MALYDQTNQASKHPWYAPTSYTSTPAHNPQALNQFVWVNNSGTVDMWPVAARSEMTFIDNENMILYVKRVDEFGHPFRTRKFKLSEITEDVVKEAYTPAISMEEINKVIADEVDKAVSAKIKEMFRTTIKEGGSRND